MSSDENQNKPQFIKNMLSEWEREISSMSKEKQAKLLLSTPLDREENDNSNIISPLTTQKEADSTSNLYNLQEESFLSSPNKQPSKKESFVLGIFKVKKTQEQKYAELQNYKKKLGEFLEELETVYKKLKLNEQLQKEQIHRDYENLIRWSLRKLIPSFRKLSLLKLLRVRRRIELEEDCMDRIQRRIKLTNIALSQSTLPCYIEDSYYKELDYILSSYPELQENWKEIKQLDVEIRSLSKAYSQELSLNPTPGKPEIKRLLLEQGHIDILLDVRISEGENIATFIAEIEKYGYEKIPYSEILSYIKTYTNFFLKRHGISSQNESDVKKAETLIRKFIFQIVYKKLFLAELGADASQSFVSKERGIFIKKALKIAQKSPEEIGIDPHFILPPSFATTSMSTSVSNNGVMLVAMEPFKASIDQLSNLPYIFDPDEIMDCILSSFRLIYEEAQFVCKEKKMHKELTADELLPITQYVIAHADICFIEEVIRMVQKYTKVTSESEYYLTTLQSAVTHILLSQV